MNIKQSVYKIKQYRNSKSAKTVAGNFIWLTVLQIASYVFPLITMPYLARVIGVDGFGKIAFASAIIVWIQTIADWGFNFTATRDVAQNRNDIKKVSEIFSDVLWARIGLMFVSLTVLLVLIALVPKLRENTAVILLTFLMIPGHICCPEWFFQAIERMRYITVVGVAAKLFFTVSVFIFIHKPEDYLYQPLLLSLGYIVSGIFAFYVIIKRWGIHICRPSFSKSFKTIKGSTDVFINNLMPNLYNSFSTILLGFWGGPFANGILDAGQKFVTVCQNFLYVISRTFFPFLSRSISKHKYYAVGSLGISFFVAIVLFVFAPLIIDIFFSDEFADAVNVMRIMSVSIIFIMLSSVYGTNYLIVQRHERLLRNITALSSIAGFAISIPLVYYMSYIGAALTITITRGFLGFGSWLGAKRVAYKAKNTPPPI